MSTIVGLIRLFVLLAVEFPALAQGNFDVREHGAKGDGPALDTSAIQAALDACAQAGCGTRVQAQQPVKGPGVDARSLPAWGLFARNVETLALEDVRCSLAADDLRPIIFAERVKQLKLDGMKFTRVPGVKEPVVTTNVGSLHQNP